MASDNNVRVRLGLESEAAKSNLASFSDEFKATLQGLGAEAGDIAFFAQIQKDIDAGKVALADYDAKTQDLIRTFRQGRDVSAARDFLGVPAHAEVREQIDKTRAAYEALKNSGQLTGAELAQAALRTNERIRELQASTNGWKESLAKMKGELALAGAAVYGIVHQFGQAARASSDFGKSMAEVSTLLDDTSGVDALAESVRALTREYGGEVNNNAKALYDIISAGASDGAAAVDILTVANKLAIGGVTDVSTAADGLTSAMNAYGAAAGTAGDVSDALFVAVKAGKTKVSELSGSLGKVAPVAQAAGVGLDELLASVAALTSSGVATNEAMSAMKAALGNVIKPSSEAAKLAADLGLEFNAAALKTKGWAGFLEDVRQATGGNIETMGQLFGSVEGLNAVLALTGQGAGKFAQTMEDMAKKAGATDAAVEKMFETPAARAARVQAAFEDIVLSVGDAITALSPLMGTLSGVLNAFNSLSPGVRTFVAGLTGMLVALPPIVLAVKSLSAVFGVLRGALLVASASQTAQTTATVVGTGAIMSQVAALRVLKLAMISTGIGALVVGVGLLAEKLLGASGSSEKLAAILPKKEDSDGIKAINDEATKAGASVAKTINIVAEFDAQLAKLKEEGIATGAAIEQALSDMSKSLDTSGFNGIRAFGQALDDLRQRGVISAQQVEERWRKAIGNLAGADLQRFAITAQAAFGDGARDARAMADVMDQVLRRAIAATGQDFSLLTTGVSQATANSLAELDTLAGGLDRLKALGVDTGAVIQGAVANALKNVQGAADLAAVEAAMQRLGLAGGQAGDKIAEAMRKAKQEVDGLGKAEELLDRARKLRAEAAAQPAGDGVEEQASATYDLILAEQKLQRLRGTDTSLADLQAQAEAVRKLAGRINDQARAAEAVKRANLTEASVLERTAQSGQAPAGATAQAPVARVVQVNLSLNGGKSVPVTVAEQDEAGLMGLFDQLRQDRGRS